MKPLMKLWASVALGLMTTPAVAGGFTPALFKAWTDARIGTGKPVYWYSVGTVRSYPDGKLLYRMEGYDTARVGRPDPSKPIAHQYNRKIYIARHPETNEVLREWNGQKVEPVAYPYQFITYELKGDSLETMVEQGTGARVQKIGPGKDISVRMLGDTAVFTAPVYLDFPLPNGKKYQAFENYDFFIQPKGKVKVPHQLSWLRYGDAPAWAGGGPTIMHLVTWRIDRYEDVPETLRRYIETDAPLWKAPPVDLADIRRLQK
jgi:hypothetical protein